MEDIISDNHYMSEEEFVEIYGARENNLKNIDVRFPRKKLVVITGVSGSGKSSLAFDTLYAEGQRRYMESFSAYARSFIGDIRRPDVDKINGLSPVISIEQKTTGRNPRSTVGTTTEIYDFFRLLFARASEAYSYVTGEKMVKMTEEQILQVILENYSHQRAIILAPVVRGRKGHYRELFVEIAKKGYTKVRIDGMISDIQPKMQLDRYKVHDIEIVVDRVFLKGEESHRLMQSIKKAIQLGEGVMMLLLPEQQQKENTPFVRYFSKLLMCPSSGISYREPAPNLFSFNSPYGACETCHGLGEIEEVDINLVIPDVHKSIAKGGIAPLGEYRETWVFKKIEAILKKHQISIHTPIREIPQEVMQEILYGSNVVVEISTAKAGILTWDTRYEGIIPYLSRANEEGSENTQKFVEDFVVKKVCPTCQGSRLKKEALYFKIDDKNIAELSQMDIAQLQRWLNGIESRLSERQNLIASDVLKEIRKRLQFLLDVGLDYLTLNRPMRTLSGGESQRIRLATQIGSQLVGVMYILDEPSIGLHQRDNQKLIEALKNLRDLGNSVIVVEHDKDMILASDYLIDIGPGAGAHGGRIIAQGTLQEFLQQNSLTARYLNGELQFTIPAERRKGNGLFLRLYGARGHNLKNVDFILPLGKMVCVTGVSGSGKSSLIHDTLFPILNRHFYQSRREPLPYDTIEGLEHIDKVIEIDQSPIGRTPRSNPATYTGMFSDIRMLFAQMPEAKIRGYKPGRFSFNVKGGRCEDCEGAGKKVIEMEFLPDVYVDCQTCKGKRYNRETLEIRFKGKSIADVLNMTVEQALEFFEHQPKIFRRLQALYDVGLGYITLGQHATTLSGGEAQRVKLATELSKKDTGKTLYILDEPTTGLHFQDIVHLLNILHKLVDKGNTVLVIEHNLDVIKTADYIIDLGPEGGSAGGEIVCQGTPEEVAQHPYSYTAKFLRKELHCATHFHEL
ncbi:MAG: excinuclease ABC subunit UvrA [Cytophagales bacterium]|nr:excinuclease ABC subunit UvrA [Cytophagales bacterium]MDW8383146.1 excinuclease ABC subunit UvrA [Flammeovirgaceae bacterium]